MKQITNTTTIIALVIISGLSCFQRQEAQPVMPIPELKDMINDNLVLYIEAKGPGEEITADRFGDVVLYDLDKNKKVRITDDNFVDENPVLSPDRKLVVFSTAREADPSVLSARGLGGPRQLYAYGIETGELHPFAQDIRNQYPEETYRFDDLQWSVQLHELFYSNGPKIYSLSERGDSLWMVYSDTTVDAFLGFLLTPDGRYLVSRGVRMDWRKGDVWRVISLEDGSTRLIPNADSMLIIGGGSWKGSKVILCNGWYRAGKVVQFDCVGMTQKVISIPNFGTGIDIKCPYYIDDSTLVCLGGTLVTPPHIVNTADPNYPQPDPYVKNNEILRINLKSQTIDWLTKDGIKKEQMQFYPRTPPKAK
jgi:hypothetical protein